MGYSKVCGNVVQTYLDDVGLLNIELLKLKSTWCNIRVEDDKVEKKMDMFLVFESMLFGNSRFR